MARRSESSAACCAPTSMVAVIASSTSLSRDSWLGQRKVDTLAIQIIHRLVDCAVECIAVGEGLMGEMVRLEIMPDDFDVVQLRRILGQPLDGEPVSTGGQRSQKKSAVIDRTIVLDKHGPFDGLSGPR